MGLIFGGGGCLIKALIKRLIKGLIMGLTRVDVWPEVGGRGR